MSTIVAELWGGPHDGVVRAFPALLPTWETKTFSPSVFLVSGGDASVATATLVYDLEYDEQGDPKVYEGNAYRYIFRRPGR